MIIRAKDGTPQSRPHVPAWLRRLVRLRQKAQLVGDVRRIAEALEVLAGRRGAS